MNMKPTESKEMYLEVIYDLAQSEGKVRSIDVANTLGYTKPSVNRGINILKDQGLILQEPYGSITLTDTGNEIAKAIKSRHVLLTRFLKTCLKVDDEVAERDACRIEHVISDESMAAVREYLGEK